MKKGILVEELIEAAREGDNEKVKDILQITNVDVNCRDEEGYCALIKASIKGASKTIETLLSAGALVDLKDNVSARHLKRLHFDHFRSWCGIEGCCRFQCACICLQDGDTSLIRAAYWGAVDGVDILLEAGAKVDEQNKAGWTALQCAARRGNTAIVQRLLAAGAKPDLKNKDGKTALGYASENCHADVVMVLKSTITR
eukprot:m.125311 g.125311  ORF g.125311 m.125311 type:complete len:199 (+) comp17322_c0_seq4:180-776(+)